jgi:hypothetical protein
VNVLMVSRASEIRLGSRECRSTSSPFVGDRVGVRCRRGARRGHAPATSSDSAIVQDANGDILFNAYQQDMQVLRAVFRAAFATATAVTEREQGVTGDAYPFAVLTS